MMRVVIALLMLVPLAATAGFQVVEQPPAQSSEAKPAQAEKAPTEEEKGGGTDGQFSLVAVTYIGSPSTAIEVRRGFARDVKLTEALKQIAPSGWHAFLKEELVGKLDRDRLVSWRGGRRWVEVLDILAADNGLFVEVDWDKRHLYVGTKQSANRPDVERKTVWTARAGSTLRESIQAWSTQAGWQLVWGADFDYPIVASLSFEGTFTDALIGMFRSYEQAEKPLLVDVHQPQRVIYVTARK